MQNLFLVASYSARRRERPSVVKVVSKHSCMYITVGVVRLHASVRKIVVKAFVVCEHRQRSGERSGGSPRERRTSYNARPTGESCAVKDRSRSRAITRSAATHLAASSG